MKRLLLSLGGMMAVLAVAFAPAAVAASPHYNRGPDLTFGANSLTVSWKAVGLGNTTDSAEFSLTGSVNLTSQCFTKKGNPVNGVPKRETADVNATGTFPVRNGSVTGSLSVSPLSTLTCTGNQHVEATINSFDLTLNGDSLPPVNFTG